MNADILNDLAARVEALGVTNNALDVKIEVALFRRGDGYRAVRPNDAGTKVIYTSVDGSEHTHWAQDWTIDPATRSETAAALRIHRKGE
ncbi:hypothetical protein OSJ57_15250 [Sphingomonas sp. HH69]